MHYYAGLKFQNIFQCVYCSSLPNLFLFSLRQKNAGLWLSVHQGIILCINYAHLCIIANADFAIVEKVYLDCRDEHTTLQNIFF